ncbi:MAG: FHA domain-containing protein [Planctomycetes bacterium]|nr:FHA domain-containing protein [Planctomycetota bacterium]
MLRPLHAFLQDAARPLESFFERHPHPVLVVAPFESEEDPRFRTVAGAPRPAAPRGAFEGAWVAPVTKRPGSNVFTAMVTLGRARNNDIELNASTVSKFHAYVTLEATGPVLVDAGSTFGTFVNGQRLSPRRERHLLRSGDEVRAGQVVMTFLDPPAFLDLLRREGERPERAAG